MTIGEAVAAEFERIERSARERGEAWFPEFPAPPWQVACAVSAGTLLVMQLLGAVKLSGECYTESRGYLVVAASSLLAFLWTRNTAKRRAIAVDQFVREETDAALARLPEPWEIPGLPTETDAFDTESLP